MSGLTKGAYMGACNRTVCQRPPAPYYNQSTRAYYCADCAEMLNGVNADDAQRLFDSPLCLPTGHPAHPHFTDSPTGSSQGANER